MTISQTTPAKLLVADDSLTVRASLRDLFLTHGYEVLLATDGVQAIEFLRSEHVDVVVLDLIMPGKGGMEVLRDIKRDDHLKAIPVLLLTAVADRQELVTCLDMGADDYIVKPWDERELLGRVRSMVRLRRFQTALLESEEKFRGISTAAQDAIIVMDEKGNIAYWNPAAESMFGYSEEEALGTNAHRLLAPKQLHDAHSRAFPQFQATGDGAAVGKTTEWMAIRKNGEEFPIEMSVSAVQNGGRWHAVGIVRDITERKKAETDLETLNNRLFEQSRRVGKAEVATSVLHNVGNVLNSVNVSAGVICEKLRSSGVSDLLKATDLLEQHVDDLGTYMAQDERGKHLAPFLIDLSGQMADDEKTILSEVQGLVKNIAHIKDIVALQQSQGDVGGLIQEASLAELVEDALRINIASIDRHGIEIVRDFEELPTVSIDRQKLLQVLVNVVSNAKYALIHSESNEKRLVVRLRRAGADRVRIDVEDNGVGITAKNLTRIFSHGFTTRKEGHGFGLHSAVLAVEELQGTLTARSDGPGKGAIFSVETPIKIHPGRALGGRGELAAR